MADIVLRREARKLKWIVFDMIWGPTLFKAQTETTAFFYKYHFSRMASGR